MNGAVPSEDHIRDALSDELGLLTGNDSFTIAEFALDGATIFEVSRDEHGTPAAVKWKYAYEDGALLGPDQWLAAIADTNRFYRDVAPAFVVRTPEQLPDRLSDLLPGPRLVPVHECKAPLGDLLRTAMRESPLTLAYQLMVLSRGPGGQLALTGEPLFWPGDTQGRQVSVPVSCAPTDAAGIAFAVVTREPRPDLPPQARRPRVLQLQAAPIPPDSYVLTAVLTRPGQVRFDGLPVPLGESSRSWDELTRLVPGQLAVQEPVHLICLAEECGTNDRMQQRIYRLEALITTAQAGGVPLRVSVVSYGAHGVAWLVEDRPPKVRAWAASASEAITALRGLASRRVDEREYPRAAQLECALKLVRERLAGRDGSRPAGGRPVIVAAGGRPPHPPGLDTVQQIIPCPEWVDGWSEFGRLHSQPGIKFGALLDPQCNGGLWHQLGEHGTETVDDAVDMDRFAADLGMGIVRQTVPFPVVAAGGQHG
jgi:hypothetical protein